MFPEAMVLPDAKKGALARLCSATTLKRPIYAVQPRCEEWTT